MVFASIGLCKHALDKFFGLLSFVTIVVLILGPHYRSNGLDVHAYCTESNS